jgi:cell fate regulator YaaT (PSP1 superfamily)
LVRVVGVRFKTAGKVYYFDPAELPLRFGTKVVVETARGIEYGDVVVGPKEVDDDQVVHPLKRVIRIGTPQDAAVAAENKRKEKEAFGIALKKIQQLNLDMNLVDVEYTFDGSKNIFYFTAEGRVDFRELVRELAAIFRTRIEMRQIGVRDEAKLLGGIGPCGRILCCTSFLGDFAPVSIRMAKDQNLSLNPSKISGLCGRLMCCLRFEQDTYEAAKKDPTLAPGYVPPNLPAEAEESEELDEQPTPAIGFRGSFSPRIAEASGLAQEAQRERPQGGVRSGGQSGGSLGDRPSKNAGGRPSPQGQPGGAPRGEKRGGQPSGKGKHPGTQAQSSYPGERLAGEKFRGGQASGGQRPPKGQAHQGGRSGKPGGPEVRHANAEGRQASVEVGRRPAGQGGKPFGGRPKEKAERQPQGGQNRPPRQQGQTVRAEVKEL